MRLPQKALVANPHFRTLMAMVMLLVITIALSWKLVLSDEYTWLNNPDLAHQVLPWMQVQAREWHEGRFPLWDHYHWAGQPLVGQTQPGAVYPPNWLLFLAPLREGFVTFTALNWYLASIRFLAAISGFWFCRMLGASRMGSVLGGLVYGFGGMVGSIDWPQMLNGAVWAPLVLGFLFRTVEHPLRSGRILSAALAGACYGMCWLSGHHQVPTFLGLAVVGLLATFWWQGRMDTRGAAWAGLLFAGFGLTIGAAQILPSLEYGRHALRWVGAAQPVTWAERVPYFAHSEHSAHALWNTLSIVIPGLGWNSSAFVGLTAAFLAFLGASLWRRDWRVPILAVLAVVAMLFSMASTFGLHGWIYAVAPLVHRARNPSFAVFLFHIPIAGLAAFGLDQIREGTKPEWMRKVVWGLSALAAIIYGVSLAQHLNGAPGAEVHARVGAVAIVCLLLVMVLTFFRKGLVGPPTVALGLAALCVLELSTVAGAQYFSREQGWPFLKPMEWSRPLAEFLRKQTGAESGRVTIERDLIAFNFGDWFGVEQTNGYNGVTANVFRANEDLNTHLLLSERYSIAKKPSRPEQELVFEGPNEVKIFRNPDAFPRVWSVHQARGEPDMDHVLAHLARPLSELRTEVVLPGVVPRLERCDGQPDDVTLVSRGQSRAVVQARMSCRGMVVLNDTYFPGWKASVDGHPAEIFEAYGLVRGVVVDAGEHRVEYHYRPMSVILGAALTVSGALALLALSFAHWHRRRPDRLTSDSRSE